MQILNFREKLMVLRAPTMCFINSREAIAEAINGLLLLFLNFVVRFLLRPYNVNQFKSAFCPFVHLVSTELRA